jgi:hypothetical protein
MILPPLIIYLGAKGGAWITAHTQAGRAQTWLLRGTALATSATAAVEQIWADKAKDSATKKADCLKLLVTMIGGETGLAAEARLQGLPVDAIQAQIDSFIEEAVGAMNDGKKVYGDEGPLDPAKFLADLNAAIARFAAASKSESSGVVKVDPTGAVKQ